jgi:hypothetical protein
VTSLELQRALGRMPSRAAQTLILRCLEGRSVETCASLYGVGVPQWQILFFDAARALAGDPVPLADPQRARLADRLQRAAGPPEQGSMHEPRIVALAALLQSLVDQRDEVQRLLFEAERAEASSPARVRETWLRRLAVVVIIAVSLFVWMRERSKPPTPSPSHFPLPPRPVR